MPKLDLTNGLDHIKIPSSNFSFSAVRPEDLGATEYTLVTIAMDVSGSVESYAANLLDTLKEAVRACKKSPRSENILVRVISFNQTVGEIHGFVPLDAVDPDGYVALHCSGSTALFDAVFSAVGAARTYASVLIQQDYAVNCICFIVTDGEDNASANSPASIRNMTAGLVQREELGGLISVLVGVNSRNSAAYLKDFKDQGGLDQYIDMGDVSPAKLAKLAGFISRSISTQSQAIGGSANIGNLTF